MLHPEYPVISFLSVFLLVCSAPSHFRARNIATISLILWLAVLSIIRGVNSIAWADNVDIKLLVWCDITTKIDIGFSIAVPASALCLMIHLESIASTRSVQSTARDKRCRHIFEFVMCFVLPLIFMALHYIVQGHRFDIYQDQGCFPTIFNSIPAIFILWVPPLLFACISFVFAALSLRHFLRHRISFSTHLQNGSSISAHRYFRLMLLALVEMIWDLGTNVWVLWSNFTIPLRPWTNWDDVHSNFSRVQPFPYILLPQSIINANIFVWWILPVSCFIVFIIFGTAHEAIADFRAAFNWFRRCILRQKVSGNSSQLSSVSRSLPTVRRDIHVSIPSARAADVSPLESKDSPTKPFSLRSSTNQTFDGRSLSRSSIFSETRSEITPTFPPALSLPSVNAETCPSPLGSNVAPEIPVPSSADPHINNTRMSYNSDLGISVSEPFLYTRRFSWRSDRAIPSLPNYQPNTVDSDCNDYINVDDKTPPV